MNKRLWSLFAVVIVLTAVLFFASFERGLTWSSVLVASVAALALFVGALIAPPTWRKPSVEDKIPQQEWEKRKLTQVVASSLVAVAAAFIFNASPGIAAMVGIGTALMVGAVYSEKPSRDDSGA